jgi:hypothetical protein
LGKQGETKMFILQALQFDGSWYTISTHDTKWNAVEPMQCRGGYRRRAVRYRIIERDR